MRRACGPPESRASTTYWHRTDAPTDHPDEGARNVPGRLRVVYGRLHNGRWRRTRAALPPVASVPICTTSRSNRSMGTWTSTYWPRQTRYPVGPGGRRQALPPDASELTMKSTTFQNDYLAPLHSQHLSAFVPGMVVILRAPRGHRCQHDGCLLSVCHHHCGARRRCTTAPFTWVEEA